MSKKIPSFFMLFSCLLVAAQTKIDPKIADREFRQKEIEYKKRFEGFYIYQNEKKRRRTQREKAAGTHRNLREAQQQAHEKARKEFVKSSKKKTRPSDEKWLAEIKKREELQKQKRREYVKRRDRFRRLKARSRQIPEEEEVGL